MVDECDVRLETRGQLECASAVAGLPHDGELGRECEARRRSSRNIS